MGRIPPQGAERTEDRDAALFRSPASGFPVALRRGPLPRLGFNGRQRKIIAGVGVADIADHRAEQGIVFGHLAVLDVASNQIAQDAPEIFVARIGHE